MKDGKITRKSKPKDLIAFESRYDVYTPENIKRHLNTYWAKHGGFLTSAGASDIPEMGMESSNLPPSSRSAYPGTSGSGEASSTLKRRSVHEAVDYDEGEKKEDTEEAVVCKLTNYPCLVVPWSTYEEESDDEEQEEAEAKEVQQLP